MRDQDRAAAEQCDTIIQEAIGRINETGIPLHVMIDRLATYAAYASVIYAGKAHTAEQFRTIGDTVEAGVFDGVDGARGRS